MINHSDLKYREMEFKTKFEITFTSFGYIEGYINCDKPFISKCRKCGHTQERNASCIRHPSRELQCNKCIKINSGINKQIREKKYKQKAAKAMIERKRIRHEETVKRNLVKREEEKTERLKEPIHCKECSKSFVRVYTAQRYCNDVCKNRADNRMNEINRKHKLKENGAIDWDITLSKLIGRDKNVCKICGQSIDSKDYYYDNNGYFIAGNEYPSIDHIRPVSKGGTHTWGNIQLAHRHCNSIKRDREFYECDNGQIKFAI